MPHVERPQSKHSIIELGATAMADSDIQLAKVVELFTKHSTKDGFVPTALLKKILGACCSSLSQEEVARLVEAMDAQGAGQVPLSYFISWMFRTFEDHIEEWRTDAELEKFASSLPPGLEKLGLSFVCPDQFTDRGLALIGSGLPATLKHLALAFEFSWTECHISKEGFGKLVVGFPKGLSSLDLTLRNDELGDEALEMLAKAMPPSLSKAVINFKDNDSFTDAGFCALIGGFPSSLKELSLNFDTNGRLSDVTLKTLAAWLSKTGGLRKLQFISNSTHQVSKQGLQELCSSLPSLRQLRLEFQSSDAPELCDQFVVKDESIAFVKDKVS